MLYLCKLSSKAKEQPSYRASAYSFSGPKDFLISYHSVSVTYEHQWKKEEGRPEKNLREYLTTRNTAEIQMCYFNLILQI